MKEAFVEITLGLNPLDPEGHKLLIDIIQAAPDETLVKAFIFFDRIMKQYTGKFPNILHNTLYIFLASLLVANYHSSPQRRWPDIFDKLLAKTQETPETPDLYTALLLFRSIACYPIPTIDPKPLVISNEEYTAKVFYIQHDFITDKLFGKKTCLVQSLAKPTILFLYL